ncbi:MAG: carboxypeptidase regulatory-like domain-containing protein [Planctomycetes bacterium]|nr:carboxypeptidase regulatory-like domain-containing protein [Planctomycetota bacterium]
MCTLFVAALFSLLPQQPAAPPPKPLVVRGMVLDGELRPAREVAIAVIADENVEPAAALATPAVRTAADGTFAVTVDESMHALLLGGGKFATMQALISRLQNRSGEVDLGPIALAPGTIGGGRVRDEKGEPIAGAFVEVTDLLDAQPFVANRDVNPWQCRTFGRTDARGVFKLVGMVQSAGRLRVQKEGYFDEVRRPVGIGESLDVTMSLAPVVTGRVLAADGTPLADASVSIGNWPDAARTKSDGEGRFSLSPRQRGIGTVVVIDGVRGDSASARFGAGPVELRLPEPKTEQIGVRVAARNADGQPVENFTAWVSWNASNQIQYRPDAEMLGRRQRGGVDWSATATAGLAEVRGRQAPGEVAVVFVRAEGLGLGRLQVEREAIGSEPLVVTLQKEAVVSGRVVDAKSGAPIGNARVLATQGVTDSKRRHFLSGFETVDSMMDSPTVTQTDADGRYELRQVPSGANDVFVQAPGAIEVAPKLVEVAAGEVKTGVDFAIPANVQFAGVVEEVLPPGSMVRVHWHRPSMSSTGWVREYGDATDLSTDGAFRFPALHPKPWELQLVCVAPPRGGPRLKLPIGVWDGAAPGDAPRFASSGPIRARGVVGGPIPWQRLGVAGFWRSRANHVTSSFSIDGPVALVQSNRSFSILTPRQPHALLLFDVLTGVALEWRTVTDFAAETPAAVEFAGTAIEAEVSLGVTPDRPLGSLVRVAFEPEPEQWPAGVGAILPASKGRMEQRHGMHFDAVAGESIRYWLQARSGKLRIDGHEPVDVGSVTGAITLSAPR